VPKLVFFGLNKLTTALSVLSLVDIHLFSGFISLFMNEAVCFSFYNEGRLIFSPLENDYNPSKT
jgi:hypothetical protein